MIFFLLQKLVTNKEEVVSLDLAVNTTLKYVSASDIPVMEVILWMDSETNTIITFILNEKNALPIIKKISDIRQLIGTLDVTIIPNPYFKFINEDEIPENHKKIRDTRWSLIKDIVSNEPDIYIKTNRNKLIQKLMSEKGLKHHKDIYRYLRQYWTNGKTPNSLLPNYKNSGGKGKEKSSGDLKRGRRSENYNGINVTPEIKQIILKSFKEFYNNKNQLTLKEAYQKMLENYFIDGYYTNQQGALVPSIKKDGYPKFHQFVYWGKKEFSTKDFQEKRNSKRENSLNNRQD